MSKTTDGLSVFLCHTGSCCASISSTEDGGMRIEDADKPERGGITLTRDEVAELKRAIQNGNI